MKISLKQLKKIIKEEIDHNKLDQVLFDCVGGDYKDDIELLQNCIDACKSEGLNLTDIEVKDALDAYIEDNEEDWA